MPPVTVPVPIATSYFQYDQQGVVFNMWYFGWFDDAMTQFVSEVGYPHTEMNADGVDVQLVHTEADWRRGGRAPAKGGGRVAPGRGRPARRAPRVPAPPGAPGRP